MNPNDPMTRSGARWCEEHDRWECSAKKPNHHAPAIRGMDKCRHHVGRSTAVAKALGEANLMAWTTEAISRDLEPLDPGEVVLNQMRVAVMKADLLGVMVRWQLEVDDEAGLVGTTWTSGADGARVESGERVRALVTEEGVWRDRAVRYAKTAHDMGIDNRRIEIEESVAQRILGSFLDAMALARDVLTAELRARMADAFLEGLGHEPVVVAGEVEGAPS